MEVGLTYDLRDEYLPHPDAAPDHLGEFDSEETIDYLEAAIAHTGHVVRRIGNFESLVRFLARGESVDIVFNIAEGMWGRGREAQVPAILEAYRIPHVFSDQLTMALCLDKGMTKRLWQHAGLPTPEFCVIADPSEFAQCLAPLPGRPVFVKPLHEGTSKGINGGAVAGSIAGLEAQVAWVLGTYQQPALVERCLKGPEFTVGILGNGSHARAFGVLQVKVKDPNGIYGFIQKEECESRVGYTSVEPSALRDCLTKLALRAYHVVECKDAGRVDFRLDLDGNPYLLEINPLPGLHPTHSDLPMMAPYAGVSYDALIAEILQHAIDRWGL
jgi:D-alanine-D-alanine ligase